MCVKIICRIVYFSGAYKYICNYSMWSYLVLSQSGGMKKKETNKAEKKEKFICYVSAKVLMHKIHRKYIANT